jgi:hypothetical protein
MAEVFLGSTVGAEGFSRRVAIKRVLPGFSENPAFAKMFIDEARISSRLVHPNIVSVLDFDRDPEGRLYLVMELVEGKDLDALVSSGPLPVPLVIYLIAEVLRGLGHAHDLPVVDDAMLSGSQTLRSMRGIVHRDVSPHNVLLSWEGTVKVSDFGIAKARTASAATASVFIKGKPAYMSPEQANGESLDGRSDLFAVGIMLWEMLIGRRLFVGEDTRTTLAAVLFGQVPRPRSLRGDVPKDVERVTMKLLERELPARYATAEDAIRELLECGAAPKDGRELLKRALAERFPQQAPVRHSVVRSRAGQTPPGAAAQAPHTPTPVAPGAALGQAHSTIADGQVGRPHAAAAMPSLGALRGAQTATLQPQQAYGASPHGTQPAAAPGPTFRMQPAAVPVRAPHKAQGKLVIIIASAIAAAAVVFAVVATATRASRTPAASAEAGSKEDGSNAGSAAVVAVSSGGAAQASETSTHTEAPATPPGAGLDAGMVDEPASAGSDGAAGTDPKKDATAQRPGEKRMGRLQVTAYPVLTVYVDNKKIRDTPVDMKLPVGKHKLRLVNTELGKNETLTVTIDDNKPTIIDRN